MDFRKVKNVNKTPKDRFVVDVFESSMSLFARLVNAIRSGQSSDIELSDLNNEIQNMEVRICVHWMERFDHQVSDDKMHMSVEKLCGKLLHDIFPAEEFGPAIVQLFGLASFNPSKKTCIWLNPKRSLADYQKSGFKGLRNLSLRIRFLPIKSKVEGQYFQTLSSNRTGHIHFLTKYLYFQWQDDFVSDKLNVYYNEQVSSGKARGVAVLDLLVVARLQRLNPEHLIFTKMESLYHRKPRRIHTNFWGDYRVLPKRECANFWKRYKLKNNMKSKLISYSEEYPEEKISNEEMMFQYIRDTMVDVTERYMAKEAHTDKKVEITINIPNGCGIYVREMTDHSVPVLVSTIEELQSVSIGSCNNNKSWNVQVHRDGIPIQYVFESEELAESFVSGLNGYYRLIQDYYFSLCDQVEPPSIKKMSIRRCHGPISDTFAIEKLKRSYHDHDFYILKQDILNKRKYNIIYSHQGQIRIKTINKVDRKYFMGEDLANPFDSIKDLVKSLSESGVLAKNAISVKPRSECCEVLRNLFKSNSDPIPTEDEDSAVMARKRQPMVYLQSDIKTIRDEKLGTGYFTEVFKGRLAGMEKMVAIKTIRQHRPDQKNQEFRCYDSLQNGLCQQLGFDDIRFFVGIHGICLSTSPPQIVEEYAQYGSLSKFLTLGINMTFLHFMYVAIQLAEALLYMDERDLCHGSICCKNILVFKHDDGDIKIKLADTGMLNIYNKLPISHILNVQRLPWIAPELFNDLSKTTIASDVYAFSTTLWECSMFGCNPLCMEPLKSFGTDSNKIMEFYQKGNKVKFHNDLLVKEEDEQNHENKEENEEENEETNVNKGTGKSMEENKETNKSMDENEETGKNMDENKKTDKSMEENEETGKKTDENKKTDKSMEENETAGITTDENETSVKSIEAGITTDESETAVKSIEAGITTDDNETAVKSIQGNGETAYEESKEKEIKVKKVITKVMTKCWDKVESRIQAKEILRELRAAHNGYMENGYRQYTEIVYFRGKMETDSLPEQSQTSFNDIPNIMEIIEGCSGGEEQRHIPAEELKVKLPTLPNDSRSLTFPSIDRSRGRTGQIGITFLIDSKRLRLNSGNIGAGHYGKVKKGVLYSSVTKNPGTPTQTIAAKVLIGEHYTGVLESEEFRHEAEVMAKLNHPNIVQFIGTSDNMLIMVFVENGCMRDYLRQKKKKNESESTFNILKMCTDVAAGMAYLSSKKILHCDLAARNVLLTDNLQAKISDFGLAKILDPEKDYYTRSNNKPLPAWWCAPEALAYRRFTTKSDVWSYGVVMWEGFSPSEPPKITKDVKKLHSEIVKGTRLQKPDQCPERVYESLMKCCWKKSPEERPGFDDIEKKCRDFCKLFGEGKDSSDDISGATSMPVSNTSESGSVELESEHQRNSMIEKTTQETDRPDTTKSCSKLDITQGNKVKTDSTPVPSPQCGKRGTNHLSISHLLEKKNVIYNDKDQPLGAGHFGIVYKGTLIKNGQTIKVAVKTLRTEYELNKDSIEDEVKVLSELDHPNIVKFYGYCRTDCLLVLELMDNGSLVKYLQKCHHEQIELPYKNRMAFCQGIAEGMKYLSSKRVIHNDLAARNVLLTKEFQPKITDFGLSKLLQDKDYYIRSGTKEINPYWCSPEFFKEKKLSSESDVWSFGIVMWEIFSDGKTPSICPTDRDLHKLEEYVINHGCHLQQPEKCPDHIYFLMQDCWKMEPENRPSFTALVRKFQSHLNG